MSDKFNTHGETGRSMIEMLGVLAITAVLSVGGLTAFSKTMEKYRINKTIDQIANIVSAMQTTFSNEKKYSDSLGFHIGNDERTDKLLNLGIISKDMVSTTPFIGNDGAGSNIINLFRGGIWIYIDEEENINRKNFILSYGGLPRNVCIVLATQDWNIPGVHSMGINGNDADLAGYSTDCEEFNKEGLIENETVTACPSGKVVPIPIPLNVARQACSNCEAKGCSIYWSFAY